MHSEVRQQRRHHYSTDTDEGTSKSPNFPWTEYFFPRAGHDTVTHNFTEKIATYSSGCTLDVAPYQFKDNRINVADELVRIGKMACQVRVLYRTLETGGKGAAHGQEERNFATPP